MWGFTILAFALYGLLSTPQTRSHFPTAILIIVAQLMTFVISNILPLLLSLWYDWHVYQQIFNFGEFEEMLQSATFRNDFHEFLTKQFCQENLLFYEVVTEWKSMAKDHPMRIEKTKKIIHDFVAEGAVCQVNIAGEQRNEIVQRMETNDFPETIFDEALGNLVYDMHVNSFKLFATTAGFKGIEYLA